MPADDPSRPLHVTVVNPSGILGGAERWLLQLLDATDRLRVDAVSLAEGPLNDALRDRGVPVTVLDTGRELREVAHSSVALGMHLRRKRPEVVVGNGLKAAVAVAGPTRLTGVPVTWAIHDFSHARWAPWLARAFDLVVANSSAVAATTGRRDVPLVPPPLPPSPLWPEAAVAELQRLGVPWPTTTATGRPLRRLACIGRLVPYKGVDVAIEAIARTDEWELIVLGSADPAEPEEMERLRGIAVRHGVVDRVHIVGETPEAGRLLTAVDAVAILTRPEGPFGREGYSLVALEALRAGRPLIGARSSPVVAELASRAGVVVSPDDVPAIVDALRLVGAPGRDGSAAAEAARRALAGHPTAAELADVLVTHLAKVALRPGAGIRSHTPISVVTTMRDEEAVIDTLVPAVLSQLREQDEYVIVDDGSRDTTPTKLDEWSTQDPRLRVITIPPSGRSQGRNAGFAAARHARVAVTDAGCLPRPGWLDALRQAFGEPDPPDLVVGVYHVVTRTPFEQAASAANYPDAEEARRRTPLVRIYTRLLGRAFDPTALDGRSFGVTREAWQAAGGFPEHLRTAEDYAFGQAVLATGRRSVLAVEAAVDWFPRPDLRTTARMYYGYGRGDGEQRAPRLVARNLVRIVSTGSALLLLRRGGSGGRGAVLAGAVAALSLPVARSYRYGHPVSAWVRLPLVIAVKDAAKAAGCLAGLVGPVTHDDHISAPPPTTLSSAR
jgi:glycosyltransferase involved in cell wall biosynthesis